MINCNCFNNSLRHKTKSFLSLQLLVLLLPISTSITTASTKRNFIQVRNLPPLTADQTFELWSIKAGQAPARMDLFGPPANAANGLVEVQYVEGTDVYAITIERAGGVDSPTMENLIGTVAVDGQ
jgi:anti-sigma-K factor RskA